MLIHEAIESLVPEFVKLGEGGNEMVRGWCVGIELCDPYVFARGDA